MERQRMSDADRERYLSMVKMKITDPKVIALIEEDIEHGLSAKEIDDYTDRHLKYEQQKAISEMYRKDFPRAVIGAIGRSDMDAEKMRVAMELYENNVSINEIKKIMAESRTALDMRRAFSSALTHAQKQIANTPEKVEEEPITKEQESELLIAVKALTDSIQSNTGNYEAIQKMLKQMETIRLDEAVAKNLTSLNEKLEKENREFTEQLESKQNEVNKGLQTIAQLRTELENLKKEMKIMQDRNTDLEQQISQRDETIREQGQAIIAKNSTIEKYKSAEEKAVDEQHHERTVLQEETVEKQPENEIKPNYDSQAVGQTQGAIPKQAATIPAGAIPASAIPVYANAGGIPVYYTMTLVQDKQVLQRTDIDYMHRKPSVFEGIMSKFAFKKKSHKDLVQLVINKELSPEQVNAIRGGLESGLDEEQLELIINKNLTPEKMQSIIRFAALQNSLKAERGGV